VEDLQIALSGCCLLISISIPASVEETEDATFMDCAELESCEIPEDSILGRIGSESFSGFYRIGDIQFNFG
jgi:hypothetical protein